MSHAPPPAQARRGAPIRAPRPRPAAALVLGALLAFVVACPSGPRGASSGPPTAVLTVRCALPDAVLWIDDRMVAEIGELGAGVRLRPGRRRVEVRHDGHHTRYLEVDLRPGERRTVDVELVEALD